MVADLAKSGGTLISDWSTDCTSKARQVNVTLPVVMKVRSSPGIFVLCVLLVRRSKPNFRPLRMCEYDVFDVPTQLPSSALSLRYLLGYENR